MEICIVREKMSVTILIRIERRKYIAIESKLMNSNQSLYKFMLILDLED